MGIESPLGGEKSGRIFRKEKKLWVVVDAGEECYGISSAVCAGRPGEFLEEEEIDRPVKKGRETKWIRMVNDDETAGIRLCRSRASEPYY